MSLDAVRARWVEVDYPNPPTPRCGHIAVSVDSRDCWQQEFLVVHGGIDATKEALDDLHVLQCEAEAWFSPERAAVGPAARAFHAAAVIGRKVYIFGGHVFVKEQRKLHQFQDLWCLNTDSWEWSRVDVHPELPQPCPRDRACMVALGASKLLVYGGADSANKRLDDAWLFDLAAGTWTELRAAGPRPRPRCSTALFPLEQRVLLFGGDSYGVSGELWSLRLQDGDGPLAWTQLHLEGLAPAPRRGHAVAGTGRWVVYCGGLSEQKSMLGIKSKPEFLADVVILDRRVDKVSWRSVDVDSPAPVGREKHTLTALSGGRLLLFGGTDGQTTLGDAWWLDLEDVATSPPPLITAADLQDSRDQAVAAAEATAAAQRQAAAAAAAGATPQGGASSSGPAPPPAAPSTSATAAADAAAAGSALAYLSSSYLSAVPGLAVVPAGLSSALSSLRGRLGLPATASAATLAAAQTSAAASTEQHDEALLHLGERVLAAESSSSGGGASSAAQGVPTVAQLAAAARRYLAGASAEELRLGDLPVLMADYRRLARVGWGMVLRERGVDALLDPTTLIPGRYMHLAPGDLRVREVAAVLEDYQLLVAAQQSQQGEDSAAVEPGSAAARPAS